MRYEIVWRSQYGVEVVDEAEDRKTAEYLRGEYQLVYREGSVTIRKVRHAKA
ncbi:MAG: hypothetical protein KJN60_11340 [Boseongicola sp.]|nr:hypothetical protein [Boseongicola sp.]